MSDNIHVNKSSARQFSQPKENELSHKQYGKIDCKQTKWIKWIQRFQKIFFIYSVAYKLGGQGQSLNQSHQTLLKAILEYLSCQSTFSTIFHLTIPTRSKNPTKTIFQHPVFPRKIYKILLISIKISSQSLEFLRDSIMCCIYRMSGKVLYSETLCTLDNQNQQILYRMSGKIQKHSVYQIIKLNYCFYSLFLYRCKLLA